VIEITSDYGRIGELTWMNTNQEFWFEIAPRRGETLPTTFPAWWGRVWFGRPPEAYCKRIDTVLDVLCREFS
jgi:hypothetical protein